MNTPLPQPNPQRPTLYPQMSDKTSLLAGTPLAIVGVLLWQSYTGKVLDTTSAVAVGGVFATAIGYAGHVIKVLIDRAINK